jgi:hypothetical protein
MMRLQVDGWLWVTLNATPIVIGLCGGLARVTKLSAMLSDTLGPCLLARETSNLSIKVAVQQMAILNWGQFNGMFAMLVICEIKKQK